MALRNHELHARNDDDDDCSYIFAALHSEPIKCTTFVCGSFLNATVKELLKLVDISQSYLKNNTDKFFWPTV